MKLQWLCWGIHVSRHTHCIHTEASITWLHTAYSDRNYNNHKILIGPVWHLYRKLIIHSADLKIRKEK